MVGWTCWTKRQSDRSTDFSSSGSHDDDVELIALLMISFVDILVVVGSLGARRRRYSSSPSPVSKGQESLTEGVDLDVESFSLPNVTK